MVHCTQLEEKLQLPIIAVYNNSSLDLNLIRAICENEAVGIFINIIDSSNSLRRFFHVIATYFKIKKIRRMLINDGLNIITRYGIYPCNENPIAIVVLGGQAEKYANENVFPLFNNSVNGKIRKFIMKMIHFHPSLGGIVLVVGKK